ncbi:uncharacterized protein LACBIDRAFT_294798 [Laccaria bicolor S238N-H82]|uniref:Predicted protein n=1 Tax=Laccaria bicolor (strain S238N-H82 / ATCC MYA-4686) TaxID=486041 RepID=B0DIA2_LACBS|nr:uncharacterized protein LACBIDRAFT_294798 [Laccaria bicolor S238N-H82]EDR05648.1 predicted protein [Laccaria bicolor S238N-H82]|eukprot:XP_001883752.1 predicted protein [Laccaria bicolor S238N-H82]
MHKNRFNMQHPKQTALPMSPSYPYTVDPFLTNQNQDDEDDNDICPVCDGECTCDNKPRSSAPLSMAELSLQYARSTSASMPISAPTPPPSKPALPSLKIKFTVPPSLLGKRRALLANKSKNPAGTTSAIANGGEHSHSLHPIPGPSRPLTPNTLLPKKRGRPPKTLAARPPPKQPSKSALLGTQKKLKLHKSLKDKGMIAKKPVGATKKRRRTITSESSDDMSDRHNPYDPDDDEDAESVQFPTFLSASALSSMSSDDSSSSLSDFDTDSSIEAEEETFILSEVRDKTRFRRELLGEDVQRRNAHNDWIIKPRKKSVGLSDAEMDVDSDATEDEDEEQQAEEMDEEEEETDGRGTGAGYVGLATGWSEDDESSFDADLFFANLSGSDCDSSSSAEGGGGDDGDQSDASSQDSMEAELLHMREELENLPFEVTEGWDGQLVFTNGLSDSQGIVDIDFEVNASQFVVETSSPPPSQDSDVEMSTSDVDDGGYEEDGGEGEGDTTDEELVGEDDLPNERAMRLFHLPFSVSAINPLSTVSPSVSPGPRHRVPFAPQTSLDSPKPADILAGKVFWDSDEHDDFEDGGRSRCGSFSSSRGNGPRKGAFSPVQETRQAIIDDSHTDIPSPHPRFSGRGRGRRVNVVEHLLRRHLLSSRHTFVATADHAPLRLVPSEELGGAAPSSPGMPAAEPIGLDDVLEASFLDPDPADQSTLTNPQTVAEAATGDSRKHLKNLSRWDLISVGAFRQTRENGFDGEWGSSPDARHTSGTSANYSSIMKSSPLSAMLWPNNSTTTTNGKGKSRKRGAIVPSALSPMILPRGDGDRTPTGYTGGHHNHTNNDNQHNKYPHKTRKELRRERKLKRKGFGPVQRPHQNHQYHSHHHHPNLKSRSSSSAQRSSFLSSVPPLNL